VLLLGAVGQLQFEVVAHRLEHEYGQRKNEEKWGGDRGNCRRGGDCNDRNCFYIPLHTARHVDSPGTVSEPKNPFVPFLLPSFASFAPLR
jgi:hypothetical protein